MANGIYTAPARVVRDGLLVCFEGEKMTMDEAQRRGLEPEAKPPAKAEEPAPAEPADRLAELKAMTRAELVALAAESGVKHAKDANKAVIAEAIAASEERGA